MLKLQKFISTFWDDSEGCSMGEGSPPVASIIISMVLHPRAGWQNAKEINRFYCNSQPEKRDLLSKLRGWRNLQGVTFSVLTAPNFSSTLEAQFTYNYRKASFIHPCQRRSSFTEVDFSDTGCFPLEAPSRPVQTGLNSSQMYCKPPEASTWWTHSIWLTSFAWVQVPMTTCYGCCCLVTKSCLTLYRPHGLSSARLLCPWDFPDKNWEWVAISFCRGSSNPGSEPTSPTLASGCFTTEPPGKLTPLQVSKMIMHLKLTHSPRGCLPSLRSCLLTLYFCQVLFLLFF